MPTGLVGMHLWYFEYGITRPQNKNNYVVEELLLFEQLQVVKNVFKFYLKHEVMVTCEWYGMQFHIEAGRD